MIEVLVDAWAAAAEDDQRRELGEVITDIDNNREGIQNDGNQVSGTRDRAIGRRLKHQGMSWFRPGAHHILALHTLKQNRTWNRYWAARWSRTPGRGVACLDAEPLDASFLRVDDCFCCFPRLYWHSRDRGHHGIIVERDFQLWRRSDRQCHNF